MKTLPKILEHLGLTPKEAALYLLALQTGVSPASTLARRLQMPPSTAQYTCQQLQKKGLLRMSRRRNVFLYYAEPPQKLLLLLEEEQSALSQKQETAREIIEELEQMMNPHQILPKARFFEGKEGVVDALKELLAAARPDTPIVSIRNRPALSALPPSLRMFLANMDQELSGKNVPLRIMTPEGAETFPHQTHHPEAYRLLPPALFGATHAELITCGAAVYSLSFAPDAFVASIVHSLPIADMQRAAFEMGWVGERAIDVTLE